MENINNFEIKKLINEMDYKEVKDIILSFNNQDILQFVKSGFFNNSDIRDISVSILTKQNKKDKNSEAILFFSKFKTLYEIKNIKDIDDLDNEFFSFMNSNFLEYHKSFFSDYFIEDLFNKEELKIISENIDFIDEIKKNHYNKLNIIKSDAFTSLLKINLKNKNDKYKEKVAVLYLNTFFELELKKSIDHSFVFDSIKKINEVIYLLNFEKYIHLMDFEKYNKDTFGAYELIIKEKYIDADFKNKYFNHKKYFYNKSEHIIINHLSSINSGDLILKDLFIKEIKSHFFNKSVLFSIDNKYDNKEINEVVYEIINNGYMFFNIINSKIFLDSDLNAIDYLNKHKSILDENNYKDFFYINDLFYLKYLDKKHNIFKKDFFLFFKKHFDILINNDGRLSKDGIELIYINFSI